VLGGGGSPLNPQAGNAGSGTVLHGMDGVVVNESLLDLAANGQSFYQPHFFHQHTHTRVYCRSGSQRLD